MQNQRVARLLTLSVQRSKQQGAVSRSCPLTVYDSGQIADDAWGLLSKLNTAKGDVW